MTVEEVVKYFGTGYRFNKQTKMHHSNFINWQRWGFIPIKTQIRLEELTNGALKANLDHLNKESSDS